MDNNKLERAILLRQNIKEIEAAKRSFSNVACASLSRIKFTVEYYNYDEIRYEAFEFSGYDNVREILKNLLIPYFDEKQEEVKQEFDSL